MILCLAIFREGVGEMDGFQTVILFLICHGRGFAFSCPLREVGDWDNMSLAKLQFNSNFCYFTMLIDMTSEAAKELNAHEWGGGGGSEWSHLH